MRTLLIQLLIILPLQFVSAQKYSLLIKSGHLIDPKNDINDTMDIAVKDGIIMSIAKRIDPISASRVIDASGMYVVPGLIDIHTHDFYGPDSSRAFCYGPESMIPDSFAIRSGVTTVVDAGSSGWRDFPIFKKRIIDNSRTRVFAFLNIVGSGMRGGDYEQDKKDMDKNKAALMARQYSNFIVGIKLAHYKGHDWQPVEEAIGAGKIAKLPVMIDFGDNRKPLPIKELLLKHMRSGDILTHCFAELPGRQSLVDLSTRKLKPFVQEAKNKGIIFDLGYGEISYSFSQAIPAIKEGFYPNSLSTDFHAANGAKKMKDMMNIMSKFLNLGMNMQDLIRTVTWNPAKEIRHEELGHISVGGIADITILSLKSGNFEFYDHSGYKIEGSKKLECIATIKAGNIEYLMN